MNKIKFHYSIGKLALYLVFNLLLTFLAVIFTLTIFPEYPLVYNTALALCGLSLLSTLVVLVLHHPLAVITDDYIRIDYSQPLYWKDILRIKKKTVGRWFWKKQIIVFDIINPADYKLNFVQEANRNSEFTAFSIPLYAMTKKGAAAIEECIGRHVKNAHQN